MKLVGADADLGSQAVFIAVANRVLVLTITLASPLPAKTPVRACGRGYDGVGVYAMNTG